MTLLLLHLLHFLIELLFSFLVLQLHLLTLSLQSLILLHQLQQFFVQPIIFMHQILVLLRKQSEILLMLDLLQLAQADQTSIAKGFLCGHIGKINEQGGILQGSILYGRGDTMRCILAIVTQIQYNSPSFLFDSADDEIQIDLEAWILLRYEELGTILEVKHAVDESLMLAMCKKLLPFFNNDMHGDCLLDAHRHSVYLQQYPVHIKQ